MRLLSLLVALALALTLNAADLAGTWKGNMETQMGDTVVTIEVKPGAALAGKVRLGEYEGEIEKPKVDGDKVAFEVEVSAGRLGFQGTVAGDEWKLSVTGTRGDLYKLVCRRQK